MGNETSSKYKSLPSNDRQNMIISKEFRKKRITLTYFLFEQVKFSYCGTYLQIHGSSTANSQILLDTYVTSYNSEELLQHMDFFVFANTKRMDSIKGNTTNVTNVVKFIGQVVDIDCIRLCKNTYIIIRMNNSHKMQ